MNRLITLFLIGLLVGTGCSESAPPADASSGDVSAIIIEANVSGMDCNGCTSHVCSAIEQVAGVTTSTADLETALVSIGLQGGTDTAAAMAEIEKIIAGLSDGKFTVNSIQTVSPDTAPAIQENADQVPAPREDS